MTTIKVCSLCCVLVFVQCLSFTSAAHRNAEQEQFEAKTLRRPLRAASGFCPINTQCVPLTSCPILNNIMDHQCINSDRISSLGCGYQGSGLVCCPDSSVYETSSVKSASFQGSSNQKCGQSAVLGRDYDGIGAYPFVARVGFKNTHNGEIKYPCAGSILNRRVILTAAHCALAKADHFKLTSVRIGEWMSNSDIDCGEEFCGLPVQDISLSHVVVHPGYDKQTYRNDIALIVLRSSINYTVTAQPLCLPESWSITNNNGILAGWGKSAGQTEQQPQQQSLKLPIVHIQNCVNVYSRTIPIRNEHMCAGGEAGNDACAGFGGAPLMVRHGDVHYQVGILSFGSDQCGAANVPSVYVNIKKYVTWIKENIPVIYNT